MFSQNASKIIVAEVMGKMLRVRVCVTVAGREGFFSLRWFDHFMENMPIMQYSNFNTKIDCPKM